MDKKLFRLKSSIMNGTVTISSHESIIVADDIKDIEKLIKNAALENKKNDVILKAIETVEEIYTFEVGVLNDNKIEKIDIIGELKGDICDKLLLKNI